MSNSFSTWSDVKANAQALDSRTGEEQNVGKATARERREHTCAGTSWPKCAPWPGLPRQS